MWSNQENRVRKQVKNPCEVVAYAMHSSGKTSLAVGLSLYKIAKKDVLASKLICYPHIGLLYFIVLYEGSISDSRVGFFFILLYSLGSCLCSIYIRLHRKLAFFICRIKVCIWIKCISDRKVDQIIF